MANKQPIQAETIPQILSYLIALNERYGLLFCLNEKYRCAVRPAAMFDYLRKQYQIQLELRKQVDQYIKEFPHQYNYSIVNLSVNGLVPQPVIKVIDELKCNHCSV